jgi:hypothetical protein
LVNISWSNFALQVIMVMWCITSRKKDCNVHYFKNLMIFSFYWSGWLLDLMNIKINYDSLKELLTHYILITQNIVVITLPLHITSSLHRILLSLHYHYTLHPHYTEYYCHNILCNEDVMCNGNVMTVIFCVMRM